MFTSGFRGEIFACHDVNLHDGQIFILSREFSHRFSHVAVHCFQVSFDALWIFAGITFSRFAIFGDPKVATRESREDHVESGSRKILICMVHGVQFDACQRHSRKD